LSKPTYIGKDEQLLSFVLIPAIFDKVYFYYFEYIKIEGGPVKDTPETPFAKMLIAEGITTYPSPYRESRNNNAPAEIKEANEITETTILNPESIKYALSSENNALMKKIFQYYLSDTSTAPQTGGGKVGRWLRVRKPRTRRRRYTRRR
jgi:hypothetical protein